MHPLARLNFKRKKDEVKLQENPFHVSLGATTPRNPVDTILLLTEETCVTPMADHESLTVVLNYTTSQRQVHFRKGVDASLSVIYAHFRRPQHHKGHFFYLHFLIGLTRLAQFMNQAK